MFGSLVCVFALAEVTLTAIAGEGLLSVAGFVLLAMSNILITQHII